MWKPGTEVLSDLLKLGGMGVRNQTNFTTSLPYFQFWIFAIKHRNKN